MNTFKVGDLVRIKENSYYADPYRNFGVARIVGIDGDHYYLTFMNGYTPNVYFEELEPVEKTLDLVGEGDVVINKDGGKRKVLGRCGQVCFVSFISDLEKYWYSVSISEMKSLGYKLANQKEPDKVVLSMDEIAEKFGVDVKNLKIKK